MIGTRPLPMRWHCLQHVPFEGPGKLAGWVHERGHVLTTTKFWMSTSFPCPSDYDGLFILGGPMNVYQEREYPWLVEEKQFIARAIADYKPVLGVCLGAQLLSDVLGGEVTEMLDKEIGWFPVELTPDAGKSALFRDLPYGFMAFHWHGDSFSIPPGAVHAARSETCEEQAFVYDDHVVALQYHLECDQAGIDAMIQRCGDDLCCGKSIEDPYSLASHSGELPASHDILYRLLDRLCPTCEPRVPLDDVEERQNTESVHPHKLGDPLSQEGNR